VSEFWVTKAHIFVYGYRRSGPDAFFRGFPLVQFPTKIPKTRVPSYEFPSLTQSTRTLFCFDSCYLLERLPFVSRYCIFHYNHYFASGICQPLWRCFRFNSRFKYIL
jgi:hypothetical protein